MGPHIQNMWIAFIHKDVVVVVVSIRIMLKHDEIHGGGIQPWQNLREICWPTLENAWFVDSGLVKHCGFSLPQSSLNIVDCCWQCYVRQSKIRFLGVHCVVLKHKQNLGTQKKNPQLSSDLSGSLLAVLERSVSKSWHCITTMLRNTLWNPLALPKVAFSARGFVETLRFVRFGVGSGQIQYLEGPQPSHIKESGLLLAISKSQG